MANTTFILARGDTLSAARAAVGELCEALALERYCEDGTVYPEHKADWEAALRDALGLRADLARLVRALGEEFDVPGRCLR